MPAWTHSFCLIWLELFAGEVLADSDDVSGPLFVAVDGGTTDDTNDVSAANADAGGASVGIIIDVLQWVGEWCTLIAKL